jgi:DNA invertase Pin-like site-specific DNA recombinase
LLKILDAAAQAGAGFRSVKDAWADTTTPHSRLMLTILGGLAEFERELIGRAKAGSAQRPAACEKNSYFVMQVTSCRRCPRYQSWEKPR